MLVPLRQAAGKRETSFLTRLPDGLIGAVVGVCFIAALFFWFWQRKTAHHQATDPGIRTCSLLTS